MTDKQLLEQALDLIEGEFPHLPEERAFAVITAIQAKENT